MLLLVGFSAAPLVSSAPAPRGVDFLTPGVLALAVMSTAFTGQAIATGFERRYGVLKRLGATPLSRPGSMTGQDSPVVAVESSRWWSSAGWRSPWAGVPRTPLAVLSLILLILGTAA